MRTPADELRAELAVRRSRVLAYETSDALGLAGTSADPLSAETLAMFAGMNPNNVGWHEAGRIDGPWAATRELEVEVVAMLADLVGGQPPEVTGFLTGGGAESNLMALWMAREVLGAGQGNLTVLVGRSVHSSVPKACAILGLDMGAWAACRLPRCPAAAAFPEGDPRRVAVAAHRHHPAATGGLVVLDLSADYRLDPTDLARRIAEATARGARKFVVTATVGTTTSGAVDSIVEIGRVAAEARRTTPDAAFYVHVDAAMGGLVVPFLNGDAAVSFGFDLEAPDGLDVVDSLSIDIHKAGFAPLAAGAFLCRSRHRLAVNVPRWYQPGRGDATLPGSRPGAAAAAAWAALRHTGRSGSSESYEAVARRSFDLARMAADRLAAVGALVAGAPQSNIVSASFPGDAFDLAAVRAVAARHAMFTMFLSRTNDDCPSEAFRFCLMPHVRKSTLDQALDGFAAAKLGGVRR